MIRILFLFVAMIAVATAAQATDQLIRVNGQLIRVRSSHGFQVNNFRQSSGHHGHHGADIVVNGVRVSGNNRVNQFNQDGGQNRIGRRR